MFRVMIFENNIFAARGLKSAIAEVPGEIDVEHYSNEKDALEFATAEKIDLFIIRASLSHSDVGYSFVKKLRNTAAYRVAFVVLLLAADDDATVRSAYDEFGCHRILTDPINEETFKEIVSIVSGFKIVRKDEERMTFFVNGDYKPVRLSEVMWVGSNSGAVILHMTDGKAIHLSIMKYSLEVLEIMLMPTFTRIKRTTLVNKSYIEDVDDNKMLLKLRGVEEIFKIGAKYLPNVVE